MTKITNAVATYDVTTNREDLTDAIYRIAPADTPFISMVPRTKATAVLHEWSTQDLGTLNTANAQLEGDVLSQTAATTPVRRQNYCQISRKDATVSGTQRAVNPAGIDDMLAYQMSLKSIELKKDMESILLGNQGQVAGNTTTARKLRSFNAWIAGNGSRGANGADSTAATAAATDGTAGDIRTISETLLKDAVLDAFTAGGDPTTLLVGPFSKQVVSGFTGRSSAREVVAAERIQGAASVYASDFGDIKVMPSRTQRGRDAFLIDPTKAAVAYLRSFEPQELGRVGDGLTRVIISEYTLEMRHPNAHAMIADLATS